MVVCKENRSTCGAAAIARLCATVKAGTFCLVWFVLNPEKQKGRKAEKKKSVYMHHSSGSSAEIEFSRYSVLFGSASLRLTCLSGSGFSFYLVRYAHRCLLFFWRL